VPPRLRLYLLFLRALLALVPVVVIVAFFFSGRIAGLLPQTWWFVVVFLFAAIALIAWLEVVTGHWAIEGPIYARALRRLLATLRPRQRRGQ
jgi:hypothetical protein